MLLWAPMLRAQVTVHGRLFVPDDGPLDGVSVIVRSGWYSAVAEVSDSGGFTAEVPDPLGGQVELVVEPGAPSTARYYPSAVQLDAAQAAAEIRMVLVPRRWPIVRGGLAGRTVDVRLPVALGRAGEPAPFWRLSRRSTRSGWAVAWPRRLFPIAVAFDTTGRRRRVSPRDSTAFWEIARRLAQAIGEPLFRPASASELLGDTEGILVKVDGGIGTSGLTLISWNERGRAYDAALYLRSHDLLRDPRIVTHELVHALGFGHTSGWPSVMGASSNGITSPTPADVAHVQLLLRLQELQQLHDAPYGLAEAREPAALASASR